VTPSGAGRAPCPRRRPAPNSGACTSASRHRTWTDRNPVVVWGAWPERCSSVRVRSGLRGSGLSTWLRVSLDQVTQGRHAAGGGTGPERVMGPRQVRRGWWSPSSSELRNRIKVTRRPSA
jgi:hypothetical protein